MLSPFLAVKKWKYGQFCHLSQYPRLLFPFSSSPSPEVCSSWRCPFPGASRALRIYCRTKNSPCHFLCPQIAANWEPWGPAENPAENICLMKNAPTFAQRLKTKTNPWQFYSVRTFQGLRFHQGSSSLCGHQISGGRGALWTPCSVFSPRGWWVLSIPSTQPYPLHSCFPLLGVWQRRIPGHGKFSAGVEGKCWLLEILPDGLEHLCCSRIF